MTQRELLERIDSAEIPKWVALWKLRHKEQEKAMAEARDKRPKRPR